MDQVGNVKKALLAGKENSSSALGMRRELMRMTDPQMPEKYNHYPPQDNDDFIQSESDRQMLLIK